jgi:hypothetical protein
MSGSAMAVAKDAIGKRVIATGDRNIIIEGDVVRTDVQIQKDSHLHIISGEQAFERIGAAVRLNLKELESNIQQARLESNQFFRLTLVFSGLGFIIVLVGVALLLIGQITGGVITSISSIVPEVTALLFFQKDKELRRTIQSYHQYMLESQQIHTMIDVAETIVNPVERDTMKQHIILKVLGIDNLKKAGS